jgi:hypothetical protein
VSNSGRREFTTKTVSNLKCRFIKVKAINYGKLPTWHAGFGGDAYIFIDEINAW